jgi:hypothetical protein
MINAATVEAIKAQLTGHLRSRTVWDEVPALLTVHQGMLGSARLAEMPVPEWVWSTVQHPPTAVAALAAGLSGMPRFPDGSHLMVRPGFGRLIGIAFRYEAYALSSDSPHPVVQETIRRREAHGSVPRYKDVPGRIEQRCITAVDLDGGRYMASSNRLDESKPDATDPSLHYLAFADPKRDSLSGNVVDVVIRLLNAIKPIPRSGAK